MPELIDKFGIAMDRSEIKKGDVYEDGKGQQVVVFGTPGNYVGYHLKGYPHEVGTVERKVFLETYERKVVGL